MSRTGDIIGGIFFLGMPTLVGALLLSNTEPPSKTQGEAPDRPVGALRPIEATVTLPTVDRPRTAPTDTSPSIVTTTTARPEHCGKAPLSSVTDVAECWGNLIAECPTWDTERMTRIVWFESRGYPRARNNTPVRQGGKTVHAYGLFQVLGETSASPRAQLQSACTMAQQAQQWWGNPYRPWRLTDGR